MSAYGEWVDDGRSWALAAPLAALARCLRGYGYTVYDLGDERHLHADPPEDHTPFSATGWPGQHPYPMVLAIDIMPPPAHSGLPSLAELGAQLVHDRQDGVRGAAWIKYLNWTDGDGDCWHESWQPGHRRTASSDRGHIHVSGRTDFVRSTAAAGYDPVARIRGGDVMGILLIKTADGTVWAADGMYRRPVPAAELQGFVNRFRGQILNRLAVGGVVGYAVETPELPDAFGVPLPEPVAGELSEGQLELLADKVAARLGALTFRAQT